MREAASDDRVPGQLAHVTAGQLPDLGRDAVFLHQGLLGEVELEGVVRGKRHFQAPGKEVRKGRPENSMLSVSLQLVFTFSGGINAVALQHNGIISNNGSIILYLCVLII